MLLTGNPVGTHATESAPVVGQHLHLPPLRRSAPAIADAGRAHRPGPPVAVATRGCGPGTLRYSSARAAREATPLLATRRGERQPPHEDNRALRHLVDGGAVLVLSADRSTQPRPQRAWLGGSVYGSGVRELTRTVWANASQSYEASGVWARKTQHYRLATRRSMPLQTPGSCSAAEPVTRPNGDAGSAAFRGQTGRLTL